jgi:CheY-like chemotaxis protein
VAAILQDAGATVTWHASAEAALAAVEEGLQPDVVLSDVSLPGPCNGIDLARRLAGRVPAVPVVLMTGYTDKLQEAVASGFRVVSKPAVPDTLLDALHQAMARPVLAAG